MDSYTVTESAARKGEIYLGYRLVSKAAKNVVVNPDKNETVVFDEDDQIVVIADN